MENNQHTFTVDDLMTLDKPEAFLESAYPFRQLMMQYQCAMLEVKTKFEVLNEELSLNGESNPIESIVCRLKKPLSIIEKLKRRGLNVSIKSIEQNLHDVAGVRIICSFQDDIYRLSEKICSQDDIRVIEKKDYIKNPKANGYRSLHLILAVPVFFSSQKKWVQVEVQFRTIAMDFWASIEHKMKYKKNLEDEITTQITDELKLCADAIHAIDLRMQSINKMIEAHQNYNIDKIKTPVKQ